MKTGVRARCTAIILALLFAYSSAQAGIHVQGHVFDESGVALEGAWVCVNNSDSVLTDASGAFLIGDAQAVHSAPLRARQWSIGMGPRGLALHNVRGKPLTVILLNVAGRRVRTAYDGVVGESDMLIRPGALSLADGMYLWRVYLGDHAYTFRATLAGGRLLTESRQVISGAVAKARAVNHSLRAHADGYEPHASELAADTTLGLRITLYRDGRTAPSPVGYTVTPVNLGDEWVCADHAPSFYTWLGDRIKAYNNPCESFETSALRYTLIRVSNGLIEVDIAPDLGCRILAARDIIDPENPIDFFASHRPRYTNSWLKGHGGVEPSFPFFESGTSTFDQKAGYRIIEHQDGAVTVAMNMRMDHRQTEMDMAFLGKYGDRPLSAWVSVYPGSNRFEVTYRAENHNPVRRSNRMWTNTFFPSRRLSDELLFPVYYAGDHCLKSTWVVDGNPGRGHASHFGLFPEYPFAGCWYRDEQINRLRIADPSQAPGLKLYDEGLSYFEIWGGTNAVFEIPEGFVQAYEPLEVTHSYYVTRSLGKAVYANEFVALSMAASDSFALTTTRGAAIRVTELNGSPIVSSVDAGPDRIIRGAFEEGVAVSVDGVEVFRGELPPPIDQTDKGIDQLRRQAELSWGDGGHSRWELQSIDGYKHARNIEMEDLGSKWWTLSAFAASFYTIAEAQQPEVTIDQCLSLANVCYRLGRLDMAQTYARLIDFKGDHPASAYLQGLIAWEKGEAVSFDGAGVLANYHRALIAIANGDDAQAISLLREYTMAYPYAFRPRLAQAYLTRDLASAAQCAVENPASPEALWVLGQLGYARAEEDLQTLVDTETGSDVALDNFIAEVTKGEWRHGRRYEFTHPALEQRFPFPDYLKY